MQHSGTYWAKNAEKDPMYMIFKYDEHEKNKENCN